MKTCTSIKFAQLLALLGTGAISANVMLANKASDFWATDTYVDASSHPTKNAARILDRKAESLDRVMVVSAFETVVHEEPSITSKAIGIFEMGDAVRVKETLDYYRIPGSSLMDEMEEKAEFIPTWARIETPKIKGYVSARSLADPERYLQVDATTAQENVSGKGEEAAGGFTSKVKRKKGNVAKGVAGAPKNESSDYELIEQIVKDSTSALDFYRTAIVAEDNLASDCGTTIEELDPQLAKELLAKSNSSSTGGAPTMGKKNPEPKEEKEPEKPESGSPFGGGGFPNPFGGIGEQPSFPGFGGGDKKPKNPIGGGKNPLSGGGIPGMPDEILALVGQFTDNERLATPLEEYYLGFECAAGSTGGAPRLTPDDPVSKYVVEIGHKLAANSTMPYPVGGYKFVVLDDDKYENAIAAPGGFIFITTGMMNLLENEDQLAIILGHEIAHCEERHGILAVNEKGLSNFPAVVSSIELLQSELIDDKLADMMKGLDNMPDFVSVDMVKGMIKEQAEEGFNKMVSSVVDAIDKPSTEAESAADERGMSLACAAGYDPKEVLGTLEALKKIEHYDETDTKGYSKTRKDDATKLIEMLPRSIHDSEEGKQKMVERTARFNTIMNRK